MRALDAARLGLRAAWRRADLAGTRFGVDCVGGALSAAPSLVFLAALFAAPDLIFAPRRLLALVPLAAAAALLGFTLRALWFAAAIPALTADAAGAPRARAMDLAAASFPRVLGAMALAWALEFAAGAAGLGAVVAAGVALGGRPSPWNALALATGLFAWLAAALAVEVLARLAVARAGLSAAPVASEAGPPAAGAQPAGAVGAVSWAASFLGRRPGAAAGVYAIFLAADVAAVLAFGALTGVLVAAGTDLALIVASFAPRIAAAAVALLVAAFVDTARTAAFASLAADDLGLFPVVESTVPPPEPPASVVESVLVLDSFPLPKPPEPT